MVKFIWPLIVSVLYIKIFLLLRVVNKANNPRCQGHDKHLRDEKAEELSGERSQDCQNPGYSHQSQTIHTKPQAYWNVVPFYDPGQHLLRVPHFFRSSIPGPAKNEPANSPGPFHSPSATMTCDGSSDPAEHAEPLEAQMPSKSRPASKRDAVRACRPRRKRCCASHARREPTK